jgi:hypothetical protein
MSKVRVSDHALVRYLERVGGFDMARLRAEMETRVATTYVPGAPAVIIEGFRFAVRVDDHGPVVTTIIEKGENLSIHPDRARRK